MADEFEPLVARLAGQVPVALLPVRIEARFIVNPAELRVRIFPDQIHIDAHEPGLTDAELASGQAYWRARFAAPDPATREGSPWEALCGALGPARAAWVARVLTPSNLAELGKGSPPAAPRFPEVPRKGAAWSSAACARALPPRFLVFGVRDGRTLFRKWTAPVASRLDVTPAPDDATPATPDDALPLQESARWLVDFEIAERAGMALRIKPDDLLSGADGLRGGVDRLIVLGVDWTLAPVQAADRLHDLLAAHVHVDGMSFLAPGTPTNVTNATRAAAPPDAARLAAAFDPERLLAPDAFRGSAADRLWRALGMPAGSILDTAPGGESREHETAALLADALWESTLGIYLVDFLNPLFDDATAAAVRAHVRRHLLPAGPFAALRIGKQPYGILPVVAPGRYRGAPDAPLEAGLATLLERLRVFWTRALERAPRLGRSGDIDADLNAILQTTPMATSFRYRNVIGPLALSATQGLARHASAQERLSELLGVHLRWPRRPDIVGFTAHPRHHVLKAPLIEPGEPDPEAQLSRNYLLEIATLARSAGTFEALKAREDASTLLEALAQHAVARELHRADMRTIDRQRLAAGAISALPANGVMAASEYVGIEAVTRPGAGGGALVTSHAEAARVVIPGVTGSQTVRQFVTMSVRRGAKPPPDYASLGETLTALERLATRRVGELDRGLRGLLDCYAHRYDAWATSLAHRRLEAMRAAAPAGVHLGAYGWLDDLRPDNGAATSLGYIHAPSLPQAMTAAVLRGGHLAHHDDEHSALQLDLSSMRVRDALRLIEGVTAGQPLAALLGYRLERAIRTRSLTLARHILPLRRLAPLRGDGAPPPPSSPSETLAARDVVDGVALLERWRNERATLLGALDPVPPAADREALAGELDRLADLYDAVADIMTAEAVHQTVLGNHERAGAVLAAIDRQEKPPRMDFVRTPRSGLAYAQRVLVLIGEEKLSPAWTAIGLDARAKAEPRLNAWAARMIGEPRHYRIAAAVKGVARQLVIPLDKIGMSALSLVMAVAAGGKDERSELEMRLLHALAGQIAAPKPDTVITLLDSSPRSSGPAVLGLGALRALLQWLHALVTTQRAANAGDLALPQDRVDERFDVPQLATRADALVAAHDAARAALEAQRSRTTRNVAALRTALLDAAAFGVDGAVPPLALGASAAASVEALRAQAAGVALVMARNAERERALAAAPPPVGGNAIALTKHHIERMRLLLGAAFPVLPLFRAANAGPLAASLAARASLTGGDTLAPIAWLQRMAMVRPGVERLAAICQGAELARADFLVTDIAVTQLPHAAGERWLALPFAAKPPEAELAIVAATNGTIDPAAPLAGLFCDAWSETIPAREETTGIAFHHDAPGARAPQAVLLAVPPMAENPAWSVDTLLDTIIEAHDLARLRTVGPRELEWLGTLLPALFLPDSLSQDVPAVKLAELRAKYVGAIGNVLGKS
jgi:hypothetical protein